MYRMMILLIFLITLIKSDSPPQKRDEFVRLVTSGHEDVFIKIPDKFSLKKTEDCLNSSLTYIDPMYMGFEGRVNLMKWCINYEENH